MYSVYNSGSLLCCVQYTMLCGQAPFQCVGHVNDMSAIIERIKRGQFSLHGCEWDYVSNDAKLLVQGELLVYAVVLFCRLL